MSKVCAIFGGSGGIGQAVAQLLAQKDYRLAIVARNLDRAQTTAVNLGGMCALVFLFVCFKQLGWTASEKTIYLECVVHFVESNKIIKTESYFWIIWYGS